MRRLTAVNFIACSASLVVAHEQDLLDDAREEYQVALAAVEGEYEHFRQRVWHRQAEIDRITAPRQAARMQQRLDAYDARVEKLLTVIRELRQKYENTLSRALDLQASGAGGDNAKTTARIGHYAGCYRG